MDRAMDFATAARTADPNVSAAAVLRSDRTAEPGWWVYARADGLRIRLDTADGTAPSPAAVAAVLDLDLSAEQSAERDAAARRAAAVAALMAASDPISVAVRAFVRDLYTAVNDLRERSGLAREDEAAIITRVVSGIADGTGDPATVTHGASGVAAPLAGNPAR